MVTTLSDTETDFAILGRHFDEPEERNVFARPLSGSPDTPMPSPSTGANPSSPTGGSGSGPPTSSPQPSPASGTTPPSSTSGEDDMSERPTQTPADSATTSEPTPASGGVPIPTLSPGDDPLPTPSPGDDTDPPTTISGTQEPSPSTSTSTTASPSSTSGTAPPSSSQSPTGAPAPSAVGDITLEQFLFQSLTDDGSLTTPGTPQNRAFTTLGSTNPELDPNNPDDQVAITQRYVLNTFYYATNGEGWADNQLWATASPICGEDIESSWHGVVCDEGGQQLVERLSLAGNDLMGQLPSELRGLSTLSKLLIAINWW